MNEQRIKAKAEEMYPVRERPGHLSPYDENKYDRDIWIKGATWMQEQDGKAFPEDWIPTKVDTKSGWKNRAKTLAEITSAVNEETYIPDENEFMEKVDIILEWLKLRYQIKPLPTPPKL